MAHPDLIKNETPNNWQPTHIMDSIRGALDRIAAAGVAMELNTSGANKIIPEMNPFPEMLAEIACRKIPVVIGADAHEPGRVADRFELALDLLAECGFTHVSYFLDRVRHDVSIKAARGSLREPEAGRPVGIS
jgi:histidinol-phosphatase (PHP family)